MNRFGWFSQPFILLIITVICCCTISCKNLRSVETDTVVISIRVKDQGFLVNWKLGNKTPIFEFYGNQGLQNSRISDWKPIGDEWKFDGKVLSKIHSDEFDEFSFFIKPTESLVGGYYAPLAKIDDGWLLHSSSVAPRWSGFKVRFVDILDDHRVYRSGGSPNKDDQKSDKAEFIFIGPHRQIVTKNFRIIESYSDNKKNEHFQLKEQMKESISLFTDRLKTYEIDKPTLIISYKPELQKAYKGSVSHNTIAVYIHGYDSDELDEINDQLSSLITHESFHIWNKSSISQTWLQEGGAEYVATRLTMSPGWFLESSQSRLNKCLIVIGHHPMTQSNLARTGQTPYHCGHFAQLIAEVGVLNETNGDILDIWRETLSHQAKINYDLSDFIAATKDEAGLQTASLFETFINGISSDESSQFVADLQQLGIKLQKLETSTENKSNLRRSMDVLRIVIREQCSEGYRIIPEHDSLKIVAKDDCGGLFNEENGVTHLNGINLKFNAYGAFLKVRDDCQSGRSVNINTKTEETINFPCSIDVLKHPGLYEIVSIKNLNSMWKNE